MGEALEEKGSQQVGLLTSMPYIQIVFQIQLIELIHNFIQHSLPTLPAFRVRTRPTVDREKLVEDMRKIATKVCDTDELLLVGPNLRVGTYHTADEFIEEGGGQGQNAQDLGGPVSPQKN